MLTIHNLHILTPFGAWLYTMDIVISDHLMLHLSSVVVICGYISTADVYDIYVAAAAIGVISNKKYNRKRVDDINGAESMNDTDGMNGMDSIHNADGLSRQCKGHEEHGRCRMVV